VRGAPEVDGFPFVEDVLLKFFPVVVAARENLAHENVEVGLGGGKGPRRGRHEQENRRKTADKIKPGAPKVAIAGIIGSFRVRR